MSWVSHLKHVIVLDGRSSAVIEPVERHSDDALRVTQLSQRYDCATRHGHIMIGREKTAL